MIEGGCDRGCERMGDTGREMMCDKGCERCVRVMCHDETYLIQECTLDVLSFQ